jgi:hypothetical protein
MNTQNRAIAKVRRYRQALESLTAAKQSKCLATIEQALDRAIAAQAVARQALVNLYPQVLSPSPQVPRGWAVAETSTEDSHA